jgi:hypothetical protein
MPQSESVRILQILAEHYGDDTLAGENSDNLIVAAVFAQMLREARENQVDRISSVLSDQTHLGFDNQTTVTIMHVLAEQKVALSKPEGGDRE